MRALERYRVVLFDCDGVILDSNPAKTRAFRRVLAGYPADAVERFIEEHRASGGVSRYVKLRRFFTRHVVVDDPEAAIAVAAARYSVECRAALATVPLVPGLLELLDRLVVPARVVTGADELETRDILGARGLAHRFAGIHGSPTPKDEHVRRLAAAGQLPAPGLFLGDARKDMEVAESAGLDFVFVDGTTDWAAGATVCAQRGHRVVTDLRAV